MATPTTQFPERWDVRRARSAVDQLALEQQLAVRTDGWHVAVDPTDAPSARTRRHWTTTVTRALVSAGFTGVTHRGNGLIATASYPTLALTRSVGPVIDFTEQVRFPGHEQAGGTVTLHSNYASAFLFAKDSSGREIGSGYRDRHHAAEALAAHHGLALPLRLADEDRLDRTPDDRQAVVAVSAPAQRAALQAAAAHPHGHLPKSATSGDLADLQQHGLVAPPRAGAVGFWTVTAAGRRAAAKWPADRVVLIPCSARKAALAGGTAETMYAPGSYHHAAKKAAAALTAAGGQWLILSAKYGLLRPDDQILAYDMKAGGEGTVSAQTLRRQAHELAISGAPVTVLAGRAYADLARQVWPHRLHEPLATLDGIGHHRAYFADQYDPGRPRPKRRPARTAPQRA